jgi:hypothetical protein
MAAGMTGCLFSQKPMHLFFVIFQFGSAATKQQKTAR